MHSFSFVQPPLAASVCAPFTSTLRTPALYWKQRRRTATDAAVPSLSRKPGPRAMTPVCANPLQPDQEGNRMREVSVQRLTEAISEAVILANTVMTPDIEARLQAGLSDEATPVARAVISDLLENAAIARAEHVPMCQDTGMVVVYLTFGQDVRWLDGSVEEAINEGVRRGYRDGYLRFSVVADPLRRANTRDNTPAIIHYRLVPGEDVRVDILPKGFGAENRSRL